MLKIEGDSPKFMTSRTQLAIWGLGAFFMFVNAIMKSLLGQQGIAAGNIILACLWAVAAYRKATIPVFIFRENSVDIYNRPISSPRTIDYSDILSVEQKGKTKFQLTLRNAKPITLPLNLLQVNEREAVISRMKSFSSNSVTGNVELAEIKVQQRESWF